MSYTRSYHKRKVIFRLSKWLNKTFGGLRRGGSRFQKPPPEIVFLTTNEVKLSLCEAEKRELLYFSSDSVSRPDTGILPPKNRPRRKTRNRKSRKTSHNRFLKRVFAGLFKKENADKAYHRQSRSSLYDCHSGTNPESRKIEEQRVINDDNSLRQHASIEGQKQYRHRKHTSRSSFKKKKSFLLRLFNISGTKSRFGHPAGFEPAGINSADQQQKIPLRKYIKPALTSTAMFIMAYQLCWFFYQLVVMITASFFGIDSVLYYYEVMFPVGSNALIWTPEKIIIITFSGPFTALLAWILLKFTLRSKYHFGTDLRIFLVWMYLVSMMMFFGAFVGGAITLEGFGYVIDWLFVSVPIRLILSMIFICVIIALNWGIVSYLPETTRSTSYKNNKHFYVLSRLVIPWLIGSGIMTLLKLTENIPQHANVFDYDTINLVTMVFAVVPALFNSRSQPHLYRRRKIKQQVKENLPAIWIIIALIFVLLFRIVLSYGIYFKLIFNLDLEFYK